jgi:SAM-dependent methyltransferase
MMPLRVLRQCAGVAALGLLLASACSKQPPESATQVPAHVAALRSGQPTAFNHPTMEGPASQHGDSALPTIDCPLRKAGVDPQHLKPFADAQTYAAFLERPDRAAWQKPDEVVRALHLTGNEVLADVGAGSGYFTFRFAAALPQGRVVATDIEPEMIRYIHHKAITEGIRNVEPVLASADDPKVPATADIVFVCDVLHHVSDRAAWLKQLHAQMKAGAHLILVEFREGDLPEGPAAAVKIPREQMLRLVYAAGFTLIGEEKDLLPYQTFLVFCKET